MALFKVRLVIYGVLWEGSEEGISLFIKVVCWTYLEGVLNSNLLYLIDSSGMSFYHYRLMFKMFLDQHKTATSYVILWSHSSFVKFE